MGRHNRQADGADQRGFRYMVSYPPDWLSHIKVTRLLDSGRQSTMTLFRNEEPPMRAPGKQVRTRIRSPQQDLDVELVLKQPAERIVRVTLDVAVREGQDGQHGEMITLTLNGHRADG